MPKSIPRLIVYKVRLVIVSVVFISIVYVQQVPNKSHSQELNKNFLLLFYWAIRQRFLNIQTFTILS